MSVNLLRAPPGVHMAVWQPYSIHGIFPTLPIHPPKARAFEDCQRSIATCQQMPTSMLDGLTLASLKASRLQSSRIADVLIEARDSGSAPALATFYQMGSEGQLFGTESHGFPLGQSYQFLILQNTDARLHRSQSCGVCLAALHVSPSPLSSPHIVQGRGSQA